MKLERLNKFDLKTEEEVQIVLERILGLILNFII
jgi:hypothetical protein